MGSSGDSFAMVTVDGGELGRGSGHQERRGGHDQHARDASIPKQGDGGRGGRVGGDPQAADLDVDTQLPRHLGQGRVHDQEVGAADEHQDHERGDGPSVSRAEAWFHDGATPWSHPAAPRARLARRTAFGAFRDVHAARSWARLEKSRRSWSRSANSPMHQRTLGDGKRGHRSPSSGDRRSGAPAGSYARRSASLHARVLGLLRRRAPRVRGRSRPHSPTPRRLAGPRSPAPGGCVRVSRPRRRVPGLRASALRVPHAGASAALDG